QGGLVLPQRGVALAHGISVEKCPARTSPMDPPCCRPALLAFLACPFHRPDSDLDRLPGSRGLEIARWGLGPSWWGGPRLADDQASARRGRLTGRGDL